MLASAARSAALLAAVLAVSTGSAMAQSQAKVGLLTCNVGGAVGMIVTQDQALSCVFKGRSGTRDYYSGTIRTFGVALGGVAAGRLAWAVLAATSGVPRGALAGEYGGVSGQATFGVGLGANVLVGGSNRAFSLQPLSVQGQTGLNVAGGVTTVTLVPAGH